VHEELLILNIFAINFTYAVSPRREDVATAAEQVAKQESDKTNGDNDGHYHATFGPQIIQSCHTESFVFYCLLFSFVFAVTKLASNIVIFSKKTITKP
jgi:hypothetical protein